MKIKFTIELDTQKVKELKNFARLARKHFLDDESSLIDMHPTFEIDAIYTGVAFLEELTNEKNHVYQN